MDNKNPITSEQNNPNSPNNPPGLDNPSPTPPQQADLNSPLQPATPQQPEPTAPHPSEPSWPITPPPISQPALDPAAKQPLSLSSTPPTNPSSLDNPWGTPLQAPPIDSSQGPPMPSTSPSESAPTDLSHLISNEAQPQTSTAETLVAPTTNSNLEVPSLPTENHRAIPKWVIILGVVLLIVVAGASAYFILGIGQSSKTTSIPATEVPSNTQQVNPPPVVQPSPQEAATGSASFEELEGKSSSKQATSAADLLRQRQQQGQ